MTITHKLVSVKTDGTDSSLVRPSNWNADHDITPNTIANVLSDHNLVAHTALGLSTYPNAGEQAFLDADHSKLDGIEASAVALATVKADSDISDAITKKHAVNGDTDLDATFEATFVKHSLATAGSDFAVGKAGGGFEKKTLAETKTILGVGTVTYASAAEDLAGAEAAKATAPLTNPQLIRNLKPVVNASVNKLDIFTKSGGAVPDATNIIMVAIPDGNGYTFRSRAATYLSGTSQFILADAANYWSKGSLADEIKNAYVYAIWDAAGGIVWALGGYSGFTRVPASTTATDDDFFLLEAGSTYTKAITDFCVCVGKIRYEYDTADTPDHTIQTTVVDAPQVIWNPKSDYGYSKSLATTVSSGSNITDFSAVSTIVKQRGRYLIEGQGYGDGVTPYLAISIRTGSAVFASASLQSYGLNGCATSTSVAVSAEVNLNVGDTIHLGAMVNASSGTRHLYGDNAQPTCTQLTFLRID